MIFKSKRVAHLIFILVVILASGSVAELKAADWVATWATAPQKCPPKDMPQRLGLSGNSLRQVIKVSLGGQSLRLKLSNMYSDSTLNINSIYIAPSLGGYEIDAAKAKYLNFSGRRNVEIKGGEEMWSDPLKFDLDPLELIAITINYNSSPSHITQHSGSRTTSYLTKGFTAPDSGNFSDAETMDHWYNICSMDVDRPGASAIAILGNSITDGRGSTTNMQNRWPDILSKELNGTAGVLNLGIGANCVLVESIGDPGVKRFDTDIMGQNGVGTIVIFEGINDIGGTPDADRTAAGLINAYKGFIAKAHSKGIKIIGATITPIKYTDYDSPEHERCRKMVNDWIRNGGEFDDVIDFDKVVSDPADPDAAKKDLLFDPLHPNAKGYVEMGKEAAKVITGKVAYNPRRLWLQSLDSSFANNIKIKHKLDKMTEEEIRYALSSPSLANYDITLSDSKKNEVGDEGFVISRNGSKIDISSKTGPGALYGAYALLRMADSGIEIQEYTLENPKYALRVLNHWDNLDGTIERGYAGESLWNWDDLPFVLSPRYKEYARANASVGINGVVLNNVNASPEILSSDYLGKVKALSDIFRPYGIKLYLSVNFASPMVLDSLPTADPLSPEVKNWWKNKVKEIYALIPDFGGFLVKANSEGQPGPMDFGRTHADGANMLAEALKPYDGIVMWRAFVYSPSDDDRAKQAYLEFQPLDNQFADNVIVQIKNGPIDFQPREPYSPLFGAMPFTKQMVEFQVTQEYLGHANHLVFLAPMWKEFFEYVSPDSIEAVSGVANIGNNNNWTGNPMAQANWYAFGRLAWDPSLTSEKIADEWLTRTLSKNVNSEGESLITPETKTSLLDMLLTGRETAVDYMMPLGLHHIFAFGHHYGPEPWCDVPGARADWLPKYYHRADSMGLGFDRSSSGSNAVAQYYGAFRSKIGNIDSCPEEFILWFHHVPWDYKMNSGKTLWDELCMRYQRGYDNSVAYQKIWNDAAPYLPENLYEDVRNRLISQTRDAKWWQDACLLYFQQFSKKPFPDGVDAPIHTLQELRNVNLGISNYESPSTALLNSKR